MLSRANRLTKNREYQITFQKGRSSYDNIFGLKLAKNTQKINRFGIIVSTKISKKATERNSLKRKIRSIISLNLKKTEEGCDVVVIALPASLNKTTQELERSFIANLKKLKAYKNSND